jgi:hypothetical protein
VPFAKTIRSALALSLPRTLRAALALQSRKLRIFVYPAMHCFIGRGSVVEGDGRLLLGRTWENSRYLPSEFKLNPGARLRVDGRFLIYTGCMVAVQKGATLTLGSGFINTNATIDVFRGLTIGHDVAISSGVTIRDSDNHAIDGEGPVAAPISIGDHVWIGVNATILKGVSIGPGAVVAAGAVVTRPVPAAALVGGVPAKVIREDVSWILQPEG